MKNGEYKVLVCVSGPRGESSWRSMVSVKLDVWSLQSGGCGGTNERDQFQPKIYT